MSVTSTGICVWFELFSNRENIIAQKSEKNMYFFCAGERAYKWTGDSFPRQEEEPFR